MTFNDLMQYCKKQITILSEFNEDGSVDCILKCKNGHKIHIKKKNRGTFTKYCNGKVTNECIQRGKNSPDPKIRKKAVFAFNSRHWSKK